MPMGSSNERWPQSGSDVGVRGVEVRHHALLYLAESRSGRAAMFTLALRPLNFLAIDQHLEMRDRTSLIADETNFERHVFCSK